MLEHVIKVYKSEFFKPFALSNSSNPTNPNLLPPPPPPPPFRNPGAKTVEGELENALHKAGLITDKAFGDLAAVGWNRAARTDKGVHAACQVISLRMRMNVGAESPAVARVNTYLPPDIRVFDFVRTTKLFNSKNFCSSRRYGYLLPTALLAPRNLRGYIARLPSSSSTQISAAAAEALIRTRFLGPKGKGGANDCEGLTPVSLANDRFVNGLSALTAAIEMRNARIQHHAQAAPGTTAVVGATWEQNPVTQTTPPPPPSRTIFPQTAATAPPPLDDFQTGVSLHRAHVEMRAAFENTALLARGPYRLSADRLLILRKALSAFKGTHAYHNFTPHLKVGDATTVRYVTEAIAGEPFNVGEEEYVYLTIVGQSFLLNQIRHMVSVG